MLQLTDLDLPTLAISTPEFSKDPFSPFVEARKHHPWLAKCEFAYLFTEYQAIRDLMAFDDKMVVGFSDMIDMYGAADTPWGQFIKRAIQNQTGPLHKRLRDVMAPAFTPREANKHRWIMREEVSRLIDEWAPKGEFDFEAFAAHFPISVMCRIIGADPRVVPRLRSSLEILGLGGSFDKSYLPRFQESFLVMDKFVRELVAERRADKNRSGEPDLLDRLLQITNEGGISDDELYNLLVFSFTAGYDTSKNVLTLAMHLLLDHPDDYERCAQELDYCRKVVEETFRFHGVASSPRVFLEDIVFRDIFWPKGTMVFLPWSISGRDPASFENPDVFNPDRPRKNPTMPFGLGPHMCLGQHIARAQIEEGLHIIAQRLKDPKRNGPNGFREFPGVWGLRGLPIAFNHAPAKAA